MVVQKQNLIAAIIIFVVVTALIVTPIVLWATTIPKGNIKTSCSSDADCNNNGVCVNNACMCSTPWGGPFCSVLGNLSVASTLGGQGSSCSSVPTSCKTTADCIAACAKDEQYTCQTISANENAKGVAGQYCLPKPLDSACLEGIQGSDTIPGLYTWNGWQDVETQQWTCNCEFPNFYPLTSESVINGSTTTTTSACAINDNVCKFGDWTYPCLRDTTNPLVCYNTDCTNPSVSCETGQTCLDIGGGKKACQIQPETCTVVTDCTGCGAPNYTIISATCDESQGCKTADEISNLCGVACNGGTCLKTCKLSSDCGPYPCVNGYCMTSPATLLGANPFEFGSCDCSSTHCTTDNDCAGDCIGNLCVNQRVALNNEGIPVCIRDTCAPGGTFTPFPTPPYTYGYCQCNETEGYQAEGNTCVYTRNSPPTTYCALGCGRGTCLSQGKCKCPLNWNGNSICTKFSCDIPGGCVYGRCIGPGKCDCDLNYLMDPTGACTIPSCNPPCENGKCTMISNKPTCVCDAGYQGETCNQGIPVTCTPSIPNEGTTTGLQGACIPDSSATTCTDEALTGEQINCTGDFYGTSGDFNTSSDCGGNCNQNPTVATWLPQQLCVDSGSTQKVTACDNTTCKNPSVPLSKCMAFQFAQSCQNLCDTFDILTPYDYNTKCKNMTPPTKPKYCTS